MGVFLNVGKKELENLVSENDVVNRMTAVLMVGNFIFSGTSITNDGIITCNVFQTSTLEHYQGNGVFHIGKLITTPEIASMFSPLQYDQLVLLGE